MLPHSLIFPSKVWVLGIYLNFQWQKSLKNQYLPHSKSKIYQINSIKSCSSRSFQHTKGTFQFLQDFQLWFNFQQKNHSIFKNFCTASPNIMEPKPIHDSLSRAFQRHQEEDMKHPGSMDLITTKQNKTKQFKLLQR